MSVKDVCELNSLIEGHEIKKKFLEKKITNLEASIAKQNQMLQCEVDNYHKALLKQRQLLDSAIFFGAVVDIASVRVEESQLTAAYEEETQKLLEALDAIIAAKFNIVKDIELVVENINKLEVKLTPAYEKEIVSTNNDLRFYDIILQQLSKKLLHLQEVSAEKKSSIANISEALELSSNKLSSLKETISIFKGSISSLNDQRSEISLSFERQIQFNEDETKSINNEIIALEIEKTNLLNEITSILQSINHAERLLQAESDEIASYKSEISVTELEICQLQSAFDIKSNLYDTLKNSICKVENLIAALKSAVTQLDKDLITQRADIKSCTTDNNCKLLLANHVYEINKVNINLNEIHNEVISLQHLNNLLSSDSDFSVTDIEIEANNDNPNEESSVLLQSQTSKIITILNDLASHSSTMLALEISFNETKMKLLNIKTEIEPGLVARIAHFENDLMHCRDQMIAYEKEKGELKIECEKLKAELEATASIEAELEVAATSLSNLRTRLNCCESEIDSMANCRLKLVDRKASASALLSEKLQSYYNSSVARQRTITREYAEQKVKQRLSELNATIIREDAEFQEGFFVSEQHKSTEKELNLKLSALLSVSNKLVEDQAKYTARLSEQKARRESAVSEALVLGYSITNSKRSSINLPPEFDSLANINVTIDETNNDKTPETCMTYPCNFDIALNLQNNACSSSAPSKSLTYTPTCANYGENEYDFVHTIPSRNSTPLANGSNTTDVSVLTNSFTNTGAIYRSSDVAPIVVKEAVTQRKQSRTQPQCVPTKLSSELSDLAALKLTDSATKTASFYLDTKSVEIANSGSTSAENAMEEDNQRKCSSKTYVACKESAGSTVGSGFNYQSTLQHFLTVATVQNKDYSAKCKPFQESSWSQSQKHISSSKVITKPSHGSYAVKSKFQQPYLESEILTCVPYCLQNNNTNLPDHPRTKPQLLIRAVAPEVVANNKSLQSTLHDRTSAIFRSPRGAITASHTSFPQAPSRSTRTAWDDDDSIHITGSPKKNLSHKSTLQKIQQIGRSNLPYFSAYENDDTPSKW